MFSCRSLTVLALALSLWSTVTGFLGMTWARAQLHSNFSLLHLAVQLPQHHLLSALTSPLDGLLAPHRKPTCQFRKVCWTLCWTPWCFHLSCRPALSGLLRLVTGKQESSDADLLFWSASLPLLGRRATLGLLHFHRNFRISVSISAKKPRRLLTEIVLNLQINLESVAVGTIVSFDPWTWDDFYLLRSSFF